MPDRPSSPYRVRDLFSNVQELAQYLRRHPHVLGNLGVENAEQAWAANVPMPIGESKGRVRRIVDSMFGGGEEHRVETIIVSDQDPELSDRAVEVIYRGARLGTEDARNLGRSADITIVDVIDPASGQSLKSQLNARVHDDLVERAQEDFASRRDDHLDRHADDDDGS